MRHTCYVIMVLPYYACCTSQRQPYGQKNRCYYTLLRYVRCHSDVIQSSHCRKASAVVLSRTFYRILCLALRILPYLALFTVPIFRRRSLCFSLSRVVSRAFCVTPLTVSHLLLRLALLTAPIFYQKPHYVFYALPALCSTSLHYTV